MLIEMDAPAARGSWIGALRHQTCPFPFIGLLQLFPYHLGEYVCRQMRLSPFRYYTSILVDSMKEDAPYDSIPNFTVSPQVAALHFES